ncbi:MAG: site-specific integrase [Bacteroidetes bacterium]|nr:site-specific integrase [Bacteroidota bacterium]
MFDYNAEAINAIKTIAGSRWSFTHKSWYITHYSGAEALVEKTLLPLGYKIISFNAPETINKPIINKTHKQTSTLPEITISQIERIKQFKYFMRSRRYSENTINTYVDALEVFLRYYSQKVIVDITNEDVINFNNDYILANCFSSSYQNQIINAIKLFFANIVNKKLQPELILRPKTEKKLPNVLSKAEVKNILSAPRNLKHKAMLSLIYSCGLRSGELLKLKLKDIDSKRGVVLIRQSKGKKDRIAPLSEKIIDLLRDYYSSYKPKVYLFEGQVAGNMYDERSLQQVLKQAIYKSKINKPVSLHWLRHSYATHLLENGTDLRYIQEILGHSSSRTTEIYTHVSNKAIQKIVSPFDTL